MMHADKIDSGYLGAGVHGALVVLAVVEAVGFKSRWAKLLAGACAGWHAYATVYHIREKRAQCRDSKKQSAV